MKQILIGFAFFMVGLGLILFSRAVAELNKTVNDSLMGGGPSLRWYQVGNKIVGTILGIIGLLLMFNIILRR